MQRLRGLVERYVRFWDATEHPRVLGVVRILLAIVVLYDFWQIWLYDLVTPLLGTQDTGGWNDLLARDTPPFLYQVLPAEPWVARLHFALLVLSAALFGLGFFTRTSAFVLMVLWAQIQLNSPLSDRAIDLLCRNILMIYVFAGGGRWGSLDALMRTGRLAGDGQPVGSWARYLIIGQLVVMYFTAGVQKVGILWLPIGHFAALYVILQDPALARFDFAYLASQPFFFFTQIGTAVTMLWQWGYPLVLLWYWYKNTPGRPGWLRAFSNRWHLHLWWVAIGAIFHLLLAITMELGIFPWAMLALYPAFVDPEELVDLWSRAVAWVRPGSRPQGAA
ncbi:MAG: HTTM domain-containing protein [Alphaproteobacteria bacterium]|nr:HTTM domain-containing protein [Alphaproteobacteria bacterium]